MVYMWYHRIDSFFIKEGVCKSQANHLLYVKQTCGYLLVTLLYVDDFIMLASNVIQLKWLRPDLEKEFKMDDLKELYICLGVEFERKLEGHTITKNQGGPQVF